MIKDSEEDKKEESFVFDTYAIFEIIMGNPLYKRYLNSKPIINDFIFAELCYNLLKESKMKTEEYAKKYQVHIVSLEPQWIKEAMEFRIKWKDRKVSITDCVGYLMAKKLNIKFLTGDQQFEDLDNVEYVK